MSKAATVIRRAFADAEELTIEENNGLIQRIKGVVMVEGIFFKVSIRSSESGNVDSVTDKPPRYKYLYSGTISTLDPSSTRVMLSEKKRRAKMSNNSPYTEKDIYASKKFRCDSRDPQEIADTILRRIADLIQEDINQLDYAILRAMTPELLSLPFAAEHYSSDFLRRAYPDSTPENNKKRLMQLQRTLTKFPHIPISNLRKKKVNSVLREIHASEDSVRICFFFVEYLLQMRKYSGANPFTLPGTRNTGEKNALLQQELGETIFKEMFRLLSKNPTDMAVIIALAASGFTLADIKELIWNNLEIIQDYSDFVIVHLNREYAGVSKHDFSRPLIPDSASICRKAILALKKQIPAEELSGQRIWADGLDSKTVNNEIRNVLVRSGFPGKFSLSGRPCKDAADIPVGILQTNYKRMLYAKAGLEADPDTYNFLCGTMYNSSTFTAYESHTAPESMKRLYQFLKPVSVEKKIKKVSGYRTEGSMTAYDVWPVTNHEAAHVMATVRLRPGERIIIDCPHGDTGIVRINRGSISETVGVRWPNSPHKKD